VVVRPVRPEDGPAVAAITSERAVCWGTMQVPHQRPELWRDRFGRNDPTRFFVHVVEVATEIAGVGSLVVEAAFRRRHAASLGMMVSERFQGRGVGRELLGALVALADELALTRVELGVYPDNERALRIYERAGFEHEGRERLVGFRDGEYVDDLAMARLR
jgi:putative acetyltransferase